MTTISRERARKLGLVKYFTGKPCSRGHIVERYTGCSTCLECNKLKRANRNRRVLNGIADEFVYNLCTSALCQRKVSTEPAQILLGDVTNKPVTGQEAMLLRHLMDIAPRKVATESLVDALYGHREDGGPESALNQVRVLVHYLSKKLKPAFCIDGRYSRNGYSLKFTET